MSEEIITSDEAARLIRAIVSGAGHGGIAGRALRDAYDVVHDWAYQCRVDQVLLDLALEGRAKIHVDHDNSDDPISFSMDDNPVGRVSPISFIDDPADYIEQLIDIVADENARKAN